MLGLKAVRSHKSMFLGFIVFLIIVNIDIQIIEIYQYGSSPIFGGISRPALLVTQIIIITVVSIVAKLDGDQKLEHRTDWIGTGEKNQIN